MRARHRRHRYALLAVAALVACTGDPVTLCGCTPAVDAAVLYGRVTDPAGAPAGDVLVVAERAAAGCGETIEAIGQVRTMADGSYRAVVHSFIGPRAGDCLRAYATPAPASPLAASDTVPFAVRLSTEAVLDSVRVDLVLRAGNRE